MTYQITGEPREGGYIGQRELDLIEGLPLGEVTVFDVGMNRGDFTQAVLERRPEARVYAFDADPTCRQLGSERFGDRVTILGALGAPGEVAEFFSDSAGSQLGTFHPRPNPMIAWHSHGPIPTRTVAEVCDEYGIDHIDLLKLDCEGHERAVLVGAEPVLNRVALLYYEAMEGVVLDLPGFTTRPMGPSWTESNLYVASNRNGPTVRLAPAGFGFDPCPF